MVASWRYPSRAEDSPIFSRREEVSSAEAITGLFQRPSSVQSQANKHGPELPMDILPRSSICRRPSWDRPSNCVFEQRVTAASRVADGTSILFGSRTADAYQCLPRDLITSPI